MPIKDLKKILKQYSDDTIIFITATKSHQDLPVRSYTTGGQIVLSDREEIKLKDGELPF